jgi:formylglycine-generating enzyme required for sulfatase activity
MGNNPSRLKKGGPECPVETVSWEDAQKFIRKLSEKDGENTYRLPTEAEWEYACRAGTDTPYYTGTTEADLDRAGWYSENSGGKTHPVRQKEANAWGLYDMHGNVWEWCQDWYGEYPEGTVTDPAGPDKGSARVLRGGGWYRGAGYCRSGSRDSDSPDRRLSLLGFRVLAVPAGRAR